MKWIPLEKRSKREQRRFHARQRGSWYGLSPVTRKVDSGKGYNRGRVRQETRAEGWSR